jgi:hypothetical protein
MYDTQQAIWDELSYFFVIQEEQPEGEKRLFLSSSASFAGRRTTLPFDSESDAALYLLDEVRKGARASEEHIEIARAIVRGDQALFLYEEKQPDGTLLLSFHDAPAPQESSAVTFASRSPRWLARFLLRRLQENKRVTATGETIQQALQYSA